MTGICKWLSVKSCAFRAPQALWDWVAKGSPVGAVEICGLSVVLQRWCADLAVLFQEFLLLPVLKVKMAIMPVRGRTDLKRVDWAQREASLAPLADVAFFFNQRIFLFIFVTPMSCKHHRLEGLCSTGVS